MTYGRRSQHTTDLLTRATKRLNDRAIERFNVVEKTGPERLVSACEVDILSPAPEMRLQSSFPTYSTGDTSLYDPVFSRFVSLEGRTDFVGKITFIAGGVIGRTGKVVGSLSKIPYGISENIPGIVRPEVIPA